MPKITDEYMNKNYKEFYEQELKKELKNHDENSKIPYNEEQKALLAEKLNYYCNQNSIIDDYKKGDVFSDDDLRIYTEDAKFKNNLLIRTAKEYIAASRQKLINISTMIRLASSYDYKNIPIMEEKNPSKNIKENIKLEKANQEFKTQLEESLQL